MGNICRKEVEQLLSAALKPVEIKTNGRLFDVFAVGKTQTHFVAGALEYLEALRLKALELCAIAIQRLRCGVLIRKETNLTNFKARIFTPAHSD
jgi:myosin heavy subunit